MSALTNQPQRTDLKPIVNSDHSINKMAAKRKWEWAFLNIPAKTLLGIFTVFHGSSLSWFISRQGGAIVHTADVSFYVLAISHRLTGFRIPLLAISGCGANLQSKVFVTKPHTISD
ncbi:hypothetical protein J6590_081414 [Homalodisca vitripennis]|nr:hypothetical protein J6590_081414 [Homalodisca vitripennis]